MTVGTNNFYGNITINDDAIATVAGYATLDCYGVVDLVSQGLSDSFRELVKKHKPVGLEANKSIAKMGGHASKVARDDLERNLGETVISKDNVLSYQYVEENLMMENKE